jgi:hypothetical protein
VTMLLLHKQLQPIDAAAAAAAGEHEKSKD